MKKILFVLSLLLPAYLGAVSESYFFDELTVNASDYSSDISSLFPSSFVRKGVLYVSFGSVRIQRFASYLSSPYYLTFFQSNTLTPNGYNFTFKISFHSNGYTGGEVLYSLTYIPSPSCGSNMTYDPTLKKCICNDGYALDQNGSCSCYVGAAQYTVALNQTECAADEVIVISGLEAYYQLTWNSCLNECTAQSVPLCDKGYIYNDYGQCVPAVLDDSQCSANGGTLQNERINEYSACIVKNSDGGDVISPCCEKEADCIDARGNIISTTSKYVQCGVSLDLNTTDENNKCTTCTGDTPIPTDDGYCKNSDETKFSNCPNPANQCPNCPADYPIPNDSGNCLNSSGAFTACPAFQNENNNSTPIDTTPKCPTCGLLQGGWIQGENGQCKRVTASGVVQYAACPATPESNNTTDVNPNPRPDQNSTFSDSNNSIAPTLGNNSGTDTDSNGTKQVRVCNTCPSGYINVNGICALVSTNGTIVSTTPCPTPVETKDSNSSNPLDANGSDKNVTGIANELGKVGADQIKKAYKAYNIFPTQCGQLQPMTDVKFFGGKVTIKDPLPAFRDILEPFRDMISNILLFIAAVIGLFDFFRRN